MNSEELRQKIIEVCKGTKEIRDSMKRLDMLTMTLTQIDNFMGLLSLAMKYMNESKDEMIRVFNEMVKDFDSSYDL